MHKMTKTEEEEPFMFYSSFFLSSDGNERLLHITNETLQRVV